MAKYMCCICGKTCDDWGNNPWPVDSHLNKCCDACNATVVVPARMVQAYAKRKETKQ